VSGRSGRRADPGDGGRALLREAGVADDEARPEVLVALAGRSAELDLALVGRLAATQGAEQARALRDLATGAEERGWKDVVKETRRVLYRFEQRGVPVPPPPAAKPAPKLESASALEGHLSPIDGRGDRLVWLVRPRREGGLLVMTAVLNEPAGLREIALAEMPRKMLRRMAQDLESRHHLRMVRADAAYCDALLAQGFERARAAGTTGVGGYPADRARLVSGDPAPLEPPLIARVRGGEPLPERETAAEVAALLEQPELATWRLERPILAPYLAELAQARDSPLVLSQGQQDERMRSVIERALHEVFAGDAGAAYRRRLEETAYYLHATGRVDLARAAATSAAALGASQRGGEGVLFLEELTRRSFAALIGEDAAHARAEAESSLIVRPSAGRARQPTAPPPPGSRRR
jgi:hypothetical protein